MVLGMYIKNSLQYYNFPLWNPYIFLRYKYLDSWNPVNLDLENCRILYMFISV